MSNDRFTNKLPAFIPPSKPLVFPTFKREATEPARSIFPRLNLPVFGEKKVQEKKVRKTQETVEPNRPHVIRSGPEHVLTDEQFIIRTRGYTVHAAGMKELFYANGGEAIADLYGTLAQAFEALRRQKLARIAGVPADIAPYQRINKLDSNSIQVYCTGTPPERAKLEREKARTDATIRANNEAWLSQPIEKKTA